MASITKSIILKLINEQIKSLDEMSREKSKYWDWTVLQEPMSIDIPYIPRRKGGNIPVKSMDPPRPYIELIKGKPREKSENPNYVDGKAIGYVIMIGHTTLPQERQFHLLKFNNYEGPFNEEIPRYIRFDPASKRAIKGYQYTRDAERDAGLKNKETRPRTEAELLGEIKKYYIYAPINNFFARRHDLLFHLDKCGLSHIHADNNHTESYQNKVKTMNFAGPFLNFEFNAVSDQENAQRLMDNVLAYRMAMAEGREPEIIRPEPKWLVREYVNIYPNGKWSARQRAHAKKYFGHTKLLKLYKKQVQDNKAANTVSYLNIKTNTEGNEFIMDGTFSATFNTRRLTSKGEEVGSLFPPIEVFVRKPLPIEIENIQDLKVGKYPDYFVSLLDETLNKLANEIITNLDPDDIMIQLMMDPEQLFKVSGGEEA
jgi:hypothetical protein